MQEEKERTTTPQVSGKKNRHRRKKTYATSKPAAAREAAVMQPETQAAPAPQDEERKAEPEKTASVPAETSAESSRDSVPAVPAEETVPAEDAEEAVPSVPEPSAPETKAMEHPEEAETAEPSEMPSPETAETPAKETEKTEPEPAATAAAEEKTPEPGEAAEKPDSEEAEPEKAPENTPEQPETPEPADATPENEPEQQAEAPQENAGEQKPPEEKQEPADEAPRADASEEAAPEKETAPEESSPEDGEPEEEPSPEDEKRLSDLTRTVQLSVEQIMARVNEEETKQEEPLPPPEDTPEEEDATLTDQVRSGLSGMVKWLLLVLFFVLVIAGFGVAWLYRSATPDVLPNITVTFAGQTVGPTAYKWKVPVVGDLFKRTYAATLSSTPLTLAEPVEQASPDFTVSPSGYRTEVTITDSSDTVIFEGDTDSFSSFQFTANGDYHAKLVVHSDASDVPGDTTVTGSETWQFAFTVGVRPSVRLSATTVTQGSVVAVRVGDSLDGQPPQIQTELTNAGFFAANSGWVCYLPIPWNQPAGTQTIEVTVSGYTETLELEVQAAQWTYKDYYRESQRVTPYIGQNDLPAELQNLLKSSEETIAWSNSNFVQPFLNTLDVELAYGTTEYVGRSYSERQTNNGAGGRTTTNVVLNTKAGELLIAPASGTVLLAKDLGGNFGYTLVIDHGAGVKSIFYNLQSISVKAGASVKQGQTLATCGKTTVAEMRIGTVPIDPLQVWRGQCDALKYF